MRQILTMIAVTVALFAFGGTAFSADALKGEQIKKQLVGNTLYMERTNKKNRLQKTWRYLKSPTVVIVYSEREKKKGWKEITKTMPMRITDDGKLCWQTLKGGVDTEVCRGNVQIKEGRVRVSGVGNSKGREWKLLKGNAKGLE